MRLDEDHDLAPQTIAALGDLLRGPQPAQTSLLPEFVTGLCTEDQREEVLAALIDSNELRERLVNLKRTMNQLSQTPLADLKNLPDIDQDLLRCLQQRAAQAASIYTNIPRQRASHTWANLRNGFSQEATLLRAAFASVAKGIESALARPQFSPTRRAEQPDWVSIEGIPTLRAKLSIDLDQDGALTAKAQFSSEEGSIDGKYLWLEIIDPCGGALPIDCSRISNAHWTLRAEGFAAVTKLPTGQVVPEQFRLRLDDASAPPDNLTTVFATTPTGQIFSLELQSAPHISNGNLQLTLVIPESLTQYAFELLMPIGPSEIKLGSWEPAELTPGQFTLKVPMPGAADGFLQCGSLLHIRLVRAEYPQ